MDLLVKIYPESPFALALRVLGCDPVGARDILVVFGAGAGEFGCYFLLGLWSVVFVRRAGFFERLVRVGVACSNYGGVQEVATIRATLRGPSRGAMR